MSWFNGTKKEVKVFNHKQQIAAHYVKKIPTKEEAVQNLAEQQQLASQFKKGDIVYCKFDGEIKTVDCCYVTGGVAMIWTEEDNDCAPVKEYEKLTPEELQRIRNRTI